MHDTRCVVSFSLSLFCSVSLVPLSLTFGCSVQGLDTLKDVGDALQYNNPIIYASKIPSALENTVNTISAAVNGTRVKTASTLVKHITTVGGEPLVMFAKTGEWGGELYEELVAPYLNSDLLCETWIRSPPLPSYCRPQYKFDVRCTVQACTFVLISVVCIGNECSDYRCVGGGALGRN